MMIRKHKFEIHTRFTQLELFALRDFYSGVRAREIRKEYVDPWYVVYKHRHLSRELYEAVKWELIALPDKPQKPPRGSDLFPSQPRWQKCPYCEKWTEWPQWRDGRWGDQMIGFSKSGCWSCYEKKLAEYKNKRQKPPSR